jgi:hypothetical protein
MSARTASLLLPVGHRGGAVVGAGNAGTRHHAVRRAAAVHPLTDEEFAVWLLAHGTADGEGVRPATGPDTIEAAAGLGVADADAVLADLCSAGLVAALGADAGEARRFAAGHRLQPLVWGLGNSADAPGSYRLGFPGLPLIEVPPDLYALWSRAAIADDLWRCMTDLGSEDRLTGLLAQLPGLLYAATAYLDAAPERSVDR